MATSGRRWSWKFGLVSCLVIGGAIASWENCAYAQITPDSTLTNNSIVTPSGNTSTIEGGTKAGSNLFHSFEQFSVPTGSTADFNNTLDIQNIISRVTGKSISNIDGLIKANGTANLFLINPNGIIFGPNARLNIGGSFVGSTASSLKFADGNQFSATAPQTTPLLTVSVPLGLQFGPTAGSIVNQSRATNISGEPVGLQMQPGKTLALVGGNVRLEGATMLAPGGRVELGGLAGSGTVEFVDSNNLRLSFPDSIARADVALTNRTFVDVAAGGGGSIAINAQNIDVLGGSYLFAGIGSGLGSETAVAGDVTLNATGAIALKQSSNIINEVNPNATGNSGNIDIKAESLNLENAFLSASTFGVGNGGTININARDTVSFTGRGAYSQVEPEAVGNSGGININTGSLFLTNSELLAHTKGKGNAGTININARDTVSLDQSSKVLSEAIEKQAVGNSGGININTGSLFLTDGSFLAASTFGVGNGSTININARDRVSFSGRGAYSQVEPDAVGNSGGINITTGSLSLTNSELLAHTKGKGNAGTININARDTISLDQSKVLSEVIEKQAVGNSGGININTGSFFLTNDAFLATSTFGQGNGGTININARDTVSFTSLTRGGAFSQVEPEAIGNSGGININTRSLSLTDGAVLRADTRGKGNAGTININARDTVSFARSFVLSEVASRDAMGNSGGINITTGALSLTDGAVLATSTFGRGNGGSISIDARNHVSLAGSGAFSSVRDRAVGNGGDINVTAGVLSLTDSAVLNTSTFSQAAGKGGNINLTVEALSVTNGAQLQASSHERGDAGSVNINARDIVEFEGVPSKQLHSAVYTTVEEKAVGNSGDINITTGSLSLTNGAILVASNSGEGSAGDVNINARDTVYFKGNNSIEEFPTAASSGVSSPKAKSDGGNINITASSLSMTNGAQLYSNTLGNGKAGDVNINVRDRVTFDGEQSRALSTVGEEAVGKGGDINITAGSVFVMNGATLAASTYGQGDAGNVNINGGNINIPTESLSVTNGAKLFSSTYGKGGNAGSVNINARDLVVRDRAEVNVSSEGLGSAGNLNIKADIIRLENQGKLTASTAAGIGGNITLLDLNLLLMRDRSLISAAAFNNANGGNITVNAKDGFIIAVPRENSDIVANASRGNGGRINITTFGIYGLQNRTQLLPDENISEINASSEFGTNGNIELSTPDIDPTSSLINLPLVPVDTEVAQTCNPGGSQTQSEFIITGRGGLPQNPGEALNTDAVQVDLITLTPQVNQPSTTAVSTSPANPTPSPIVEAQGWAIAANGEVILTANVPTVTPHSFWQTPVGCYAPRNSS